MFSPLLYFIKCSFVATSRFRRKKPETPSSVAKKPQARNK